VLHRPGQVVRVNRQSALVDPVIAECSQCPWEQACTGAIEAAGRLAQHLHLRHGEPLPAQPVSGANWQEQAVDAVRQVAARGKNFRIFDALSEFGLQSPPDAQHRIGRFTTLVHDLGICHKVGDDQSTRPGTKKSAAGVWNRNPARCVYPRCRQKAGAL